MAGTPRGQRRLQAGFEARHTSPCCRNRRPRIHGQRRTCQARNAFRSQGPKRRAQWEHLPHGHGKSQPSNDRHPQADLELIAGTGGRGDGPEGDPKSCKMSRPHGCSSPAMVLFTLATVRLTGCVSFVTNADRSSLTASHSPSRTQSMWSFPERDTYVLDSLIGKRLPSV